MSVTFLTNEDKALIDQEIATLSEEITKLKDPAGAVVTKEGTLIAMECNAGVEIAVDGESSEAVSLVHCGKNILPLYAGPSATVGVAITLKEDGKVHFEGTSVNQAWPRHIPLESPMYLPAGTYTISVDGLFDKLTFAFSSEDKSVDLGFYPAAANFSRVKTFSIAAGMYFNAGYTIGAKDVVYNHDVSVQLETGDTATEYEKAERETTTVVLPYALAARSGVNTIYAESGEVLTATVKKTVESIVKDVVKKQLAVDWTAYGLPMLYLTGDTAGMSKDNAVTLDYTYVATAGAESKIGTAEVKWQGSSSLSYPKKNYTIKFDTAFEVKEGWGVQKKYCLKANYMEHSHARNICSCKLWGEIVKSRANVPAELSSLPNGGAIDGFPCIIMLNGEFHGLYTWNIPKDGWMFGAPKAILCADLHCDATKFKALATLNGDFELEYVEDEANADWVLNSLNRAIQAVMDGNLDTVAQYIDIPSAIDYYIHTVDESAADGTSKNYILVTFDGVKWYFSAYDRDTTYGITWNGKDFVSPAYEAINYAGYADAHKLMYLIQHNKTAELKARAVELRGGIKSAANVAYVFTNFVKDIPSVVYEEDARKWPTIPSTSTSNLAQIVSWYMMRRQVIDKEIDSWIV